MAKKTPQGRYDALVLERFLAMKVSDEFGALPSCPACFPTWAEAQLAWLNRDYLNYHLAEVRTAGEWATLRRHLNRKQVPFLPIHVGDCVTIVLSPQLLPRQMAVVESDSVAFYALVFGLLRLQFATGPKGQRLRPSANWKHFLADDPVLETKDVSHTSICVIEDNGGDASTTIEEGETRQLLVRGEADVVGDLTALGCERGDGRVYIQARRRHSSPFGHGKGTFGSLLPYRAQHVGLPPDWRVLAVNDGRGWRRWRG